MWQLAYSLILYTSDDPEKFKYFSTMFTKRINQVSHIQFLEDRKIDDQFFVHLIKNKSPVDFEKNLQNTTKLIQKKIQTQNFQQARDISDQILVEFENQLLKYPYKVAQSTLIPFYFWNTVAHLDDKNKAQTLMASFLNSVTLAQRNALESQLTRELYQKFAALLSQQKFLPTLNYEIKNSEKCDVFVNGTPYFQKSLSLSATGKVVFNAICANGFYSQLITAQSHSIIIILPHIEKSVSSMPSVDSFPINLIENHKIQSLICIYWSAKKNYIQTVVVNESNFTEKRELFLQLKTKDDLQSAGDKISQFILNYFKSLLELNSFQRIGG